MSDYRYTSLYYSTPVLVRYFDAADGQWNRGIAFHDQLCTHDGQIVPLTTIIIEAMRIGIDWDDAIIERVWVDLNQL